MDDPALDGSRHLQALQGLERINRWSRSAQIVWNPIRQLASLSTPAPLSVLDVAAGGGDVTVSLWRQAHRARVSLEVSGCDKSPRAVERSRQRALQLCSGQAPVRFFELDVLEQPIPSHYDVVICSLFLHHLNAAQAVRVLAEMGRAARRLVVINDLRRNLAGWWLSLAATKLLTRSEVVHMDGPRSVRAAYTVSEIKRLAEQAGLRGSRVTSCWPFRYRLIWKKS